MRAYELTTDADNFRAYIVADLSDFGALDEVHGKPLAPHWRTLRIVIDRSIKSNLRAPPGDFPSIAVGHAPALSQRAVDVLRDLLEPVGELLPLECEAEPMWIFNCTRFADVLNEAASKIRRYRDGALAHIYRHEWHPEVDQETCFRLPQFRRSSVYITDVVVERMRSAGLRGYKLGE